MTSKLTKLIRTQLDRLAPIVFELPWSDIVNKGGKLTRKLWCDQAEEAIYAVLEHESKLELQDKKGKRARFIKREKVRTCRITLSYIMIMPGDETFGCQGILALGQVPSTELTSTSTSVSLTRKSGSTIMIVSEPF